MEYNYNEIICNAINTLVDKKIEGINFDKTEVYTIVDNSEAEKYKYQVTDGSVKIYAYSQNTGYKVNDKVYVTIPQGDFNEEALIVGKKVSNDTTPFVYTSPLDSMINITGNLIVGSHESGLLANAYWDQPEAKAAHANSIVQRLWSLDKQELQGFTRLGLQASFCTLLKDFKTVQGDYGLILTIISDEDGTALESTNKDNAKNKDKICSKQIILSTADMYGDPYNYTSYYQQEQVYDISDVGKITALYLDFYQDTGSFIDSDGNHIDYLDFFGNELVNNIFVKDPLLVLGYDLATFDGESLILYSPQASTYIASREVELTENKKDIYLRWVHKYEDEKIRQVEAGAQVEQAYELRWYRYVLGSPSADEYSGVYWTRINENQTNPFYFGLNPDVTLASEKIKVIMLYGDSENKKVYRSNIIEFTNDKQVVNKATVDSMQALIINCEDGLFGNYYFYELGGRLQEVSQKDIERTFKVYFDSLVDPNPDGSVELTDAESITWKIPISNTMIYLDPASYSDLTKVDGLLTKDPIVAGYDTTSEPGYILIRRLNISDYNTSLGYNPKVRQTYYIKSLYSAIYNNNTIECTIVKDSTEYYANKTLRFGPKGTSGTDCTLTLNFPNGVTCLSADSVSPVVITAKLYDAENAEVDLENSGATVNWSWRSGNDLINLQSPYRDSNSASHKHQCTLQMKNTLSSLSKNYHVLQCTVSGYGDYDLIAYLPIPIRIGTKDPNHTNYYLYQYLIGPQEVRYDSSGSPEYFRYAYELEDAFNNAIANVHWYVVHEDNSNRSEADTKNGTVTNEAQIAAIHKANDDKYYPIINDSDMLVPLNIYVADSSNEVCVNAQVGSAVVWSQPLLIYQNRYPAAMVNEWDGKLKIDEENNEILVGALAAGKKNKDNSFSGVIVGQVQRNAEKVLTEQTGVYGYSFGEMSYALMEDGTAFFGKAGRGRIHFNGADAEIYSGNWLTGKQGMKIDLDDGYIQMNQNGYTNKYIKNLGHTEETVTRTTKKVKNTEGVEVDVPVDTTTTTTYTPAQDYATYKTSLYKFFTYQLLSTDPGNRKQLYEPYTFIEYGNLKSETYIKNKYYYYNGTSYVLATGNFDASKKYYLPDTFIQVNRNKITFVANRYYQKVFDFIKEAGSSTFDPEATYYIDYVASANHYITMGSNQSDYPLSIGTSKTESQRSFKVGWDGTMYAVNGEFTGAINLKGSGKYVTLTTQDKINNTTIDYPLSIGTVSDYASRKFRVAWDGTLYAENATIKGNISSTSGTIGGWVIASNGLHTKDKTAFGDGKQGAWLGANGTLDFTKDANSYMQYTAQGNLNIKNGNISGSKIDGSDITGGTISIGDDFFYADDDEVQIADWHLKLKARSDSDSSGYGDRSAFYCGDWASSPTGLSNGGATNKSGLSWYLWTNWKTNLDDSGFCVTSNTVEVGSATELFKVNSKKIEFSAADGTLVCSIPAESQTGIYARFAKGEEKEG